MKRGTEYARRIKHLYHQLVRKLGKPELPEATDPIQQLIVGTNVQDPQAQHRLYHDIHRVCG